MIPESRHLIATGMEIGLKDLPGLQFRSDCPYNFCRVCGDVFQSSLDRLPGDLEHNFEAMMLRKNWSIKHASEHSAKEHLDLAMSGMWCTPEAAQKLASFGIIAVSDMVLNPETADALLNARSIPINDAEGGE